jgi:hypothetical protein
VNRLDRDTQHNESMTNERSYDAPARRIAAALRIVGSRSMEKSSISTNTMLGWFPRSAPLGT